jgi:hypothetical protein
MRGEVCGGSGGEFGGGSGGIGIGSGSGDGGGSGDGEGEGEGGGIGDEGGGVGGGEGKAAAVVVELAVAVVVAMVVEVEVAVAGGVLFGPPNETKIKSKLDNMLVHLIIISLMILSSSLGNTKNYRLQRYFRPLKFFIISFNSGTTLLFWHQ